MLETVIEETVQSEDYTPSGRLLWLGNGTLQQPDFYVQVKNNIEKKTTLLTKVYNFVLGDQVQWKISTMDHPEILNSSCRSNWTNPYFYCEEKKWLISYTKMVVSGMKEKNQYG
ncbi:hypothetical protein X975_25223, partial [Stegodyphus mimosarum]